MLSFSLVGDAARAGHSWPASFRHTYRARAWAVIAAWPGFLFPATLLGFSCPSQFFSGPRVSASFDVSRPHAVSPSARREFHRRGVRCLLRTMGFRPRLLGLGPTNQPYRAIRRPRYSFCAQGRSNPPAVTALSFGPSFRSSPPVSGLHLWSLSAHELSARSPRRFCSVRRKAEPALRRMQGTDD